MYFCVFIQIFRGSYFLLKGGFVMKCGNIVFVRGNSLLSKAIEHFDGKFSHVFLCLSENAILEAQYSTKSCIVPFHYQNQEYEIVDLNLSRSQKQRVQELGLSLIGKKYDYIQIISYLIRDIIDRDFKIINNPNNLICSEVIEIILQDIGIIPNDKKLRDMTPNGLYRYLKTLEH
jgi:hypothetical protein